MPIVIPPQAREPQLHLWTREEYYQIAETGVFQDKRVQLIEGQVIEMSPMNSRHAMAIILVNDLLKKELAQDGDQEVHVRPQLPLALGPLSEPEPDIAVVPGTAREYTAHPTTALLGIEIADSTLQFDRRSKGSLYARADLQEYWILNLVDCCLEVYRSPIADPEAIYGFRYGELTVYPASEIVRPLAFPGRAIRIPDLLP